jgi:hypothetical protein
MDRKMELQHLALAERHVLEGRERVRQQEAQLTELERDRDHAGAARQSRDLLKTMRETLALQENGSTQPKDTGSSNLKTAARMCSCTSLQLSARD